MIIPPKSKRTLILALGTIVIGVSGAVYNITMERKLDTALKLGMAIMGIVLLFFNED